MLEKIRVVEKIFSPIQTAPSKCKFIEEGLSKRAILIGLIKIELVLTKDS
jgi:hypothetical protein